MSTLDVSYPDAIPRERWADYGKMTWARSICRVCGNHVFEGGHERCRQSRVEDDRRREREADKTTQTLVEEITHDAVNHPAHYGGAENPYEVIKVIEAWDLGFHDGNAVKYIARAGKKDPTKELEDLEKAAWYLARRIENVKKELA